MEEKLMEAIESIAKASGVAVEKVYQVLEKQSKLQLVYDVVILVAVVSFIIGSIFLIIYAYKQSQKRPRNMWDTLFPIISISCAFFDSVFIFAVIPMCFLEIMQIIYNNPIWILEYITNLIK